MPLTSISRPAADADAAASNTNNSSSYPKGPIWSLVESKHETTLFVLLAFNFHRFHWPRTLLHVQWTYRTRVVLKRKMEKHALCFVLRPLPYSPSPFCSIAMAVWLAAARERENDRIMDACPHTRPRPCCVGPSGIVVSLAAFPAPAVVGRN